MNDDSIDNSAAGNTRRVLHTSNWFFPCSNESSSNDPDNFEVITPNMCRKLARNLFMNSLVEAGFSSTNMGSSLFTCCEAVIDLMDDVLFKACVDAKILFENSEPKQNSELVFVARSLKLHGFKTN